MSHVSVLVADDHEGIRLLMNSAVLRHFVLHDSVENGRQLVEAVMAGEPDVVVSDLCMPALNGLEAMAVLRRMGRMTPFVIVSSDPDVGPDCLAAGAAAFVFKANLDHELVPAVLAAFDGAHQAPVTGEQIQARAAAAAYSSHGRGTLGPSPVNQPRQGPVFRQQGCGR